MGQLLVAGVVVADEAACPVAEHSSHLGRGEVEHEHPRAGEGDAADAAADLRLEAPDTGLCDAVRAGADGGRVGAGQQRVPGGPWWWHGSDSVRTGIRTDRSGPMSRARPVGRTGQLPGAVGGCGRRPRPETLVKGLRH